MDPAYARLLNNFIITFSIAMDLRLCLYQSDDDLHFQSCQCKIHRSRLFV
jgi:hypothetical protein